MSSTVFCSRRRVRTGQAQEALKTRLEPRPETGITKTIQNTWKGLREIPSRRRLAIQSLQAILEATPGPRPRADRRGSACFKIYGPAYLFRRRQPHPTRPTSPSSASAKVDGSGIAFATTSRAPENAPWSELMSPLVAARVRKRAALVNRTS